MGRTAGKPLDLRRNEEMEPYVAGKGISGQSGYDCAPQSSEGNRLARFDCDAPAIQCTTRSKQRGTDMVMAMTMKNTSRYVSVT